MKDDKEKDLKKSELNNLSFEEIGEEHVSDSYTTPLRADAFEKDDQLKVELVQKHFEEILNILGLDLNDDSLKGTPYRVAKMYVEEIFKGLNPENKPKLSLFENKYQYNQMLVEKNIKVHSHCEHHFLPIEGKAHVAYIPNDKVIGLSKINRLVEYFAKRPQVQERLTKQIADALSEALETDDVAVVIEANHMCVRARGIQDVGSSTVTSEYYGQFKEKAHKEEFLQYLKMANEDT